MQIHYFHNLAGKSADFSAESEKSFMVVTQICQFSSSYIKVEAHYVALHATS